MIRQESCLVPKNRRTALGARAQKGSVAFGARLLAHVARSLAHGARPLAHGAPKWTKKNYCESTNFGTQFTKSPHS